MDDIDPFLIPAFSVRNKMLRSLWWFVYILFFRFSPKPFFYWRSLLLRMFGAKIGNKVAIYPSVKIWAPWLLQCDDLVAIANGVEIYNPKMVRIGSHAIVSQGAYLCGASHDYNDPRFPLFSREIVIEDYAWVCARASVMPGVTIKTGGVLGLGSVATKDVPEWTVHAGLPAVFVRHRQRN